MEVLAGAACAGRASASGMTTEEPSWQFCTPAVRDPRTFQGKPLVWESLIVLEEKTGQIFEPSESIIDVTPDGFNTVTSETPPRNPVVPPDRFASAILSDLLRQHDPEEVDWWRSKGFRPNLDDNAQSSSPWKIVEEAVSACTRDLRNSGYHPEAVLVAVKSGMRQAAASLVPAQAVANLIRKTGQACIAAYFETPHSVEAASERPPVSIPRGASTVGLQMWERPEKSRDLPLTSLGDS